MKPTEEGGRAQICARDALCALGYPIYLGAGSRGWVCAKAETSALVLGPPRSGKTSSIVIPNILGAGGPVLSTSTKLDVASATASARLEIGKCWLFDPSGYTTCPQGVTELRWSPVTAAVTWEGALAAARALVRAAGPARGLEGSSHWVERAEVLLGPVLHAAALAGSGMQEVFSAVNRRELLGAVSVLEASGARAALDSLVGITATEERELSGIYSTASSVLSAYRSSAAMSRAEQPNFHPAAFVRSTDTVYVAAPSHAQDLVAPIVACFVDSICQQAYLLATHSPENTTHARSSKGALGDIAPEVGNPSPPSSGKLIPPLLLALDEVANIAPLAGLPAVVSDGGSQGIQVLACLQDLSQARSRWGEMAEGFLSLFGSKVVLAGIGDRRTLELVSMLAGDVEVALRSTAQVAQRWWHSGPRKPPTVTLSTRRQPRLPPSAVAAGRPGMALWIEGGKAPAWLQLTPWYSHPVWSAAALLERDARSSVSRALNAANGRDRGRHLDGFGLRR